jgi:hypothetical protein
VLVRHDSLFGRGMNAAAASYQHYVYIGNRIDGSSTCGAGDPRPGGIYSLARVDGPGPGKDARLLGKETDSGVMSGLPTSSWIWA